jgi:hypothetical protein
MRLKYGFPILLSLSLFFMGSQQSNGETYNKVWLIKQFDTFDLALKNGEGYSKETNDNAALAWGEAWLLEGYLDMYETTGQRKYIEKFAVQSERVANNSDKSRGIKDYKGRNLMGWSSTHYSKNNKPVVFLAHTGTILNPLVKFAVMVKNHPELSNYKNLASRYEEMAKMAVSENEHLWRYDVRSGQGNYWLEGDEPMTVAYRKIPIPTPLPYNGSLAFGKVLLGLYELTGIDNYRSKAAALALYFKTGLSTTGNGAYVWGYRKDLSKPPEDLSHGSVDVDFAVQAYRADIVFTKTDLRAFATTLVECNKRGKLSMYVDGTDNPKAYADYNFASLEWLELASIDCRPYGIALDYAVNKMKTTKVVSPVVLLGIAKLAKYSGTCGK